MRLPEIIIIIFFLIIIGLIALPNFDPCGPRYSTARVESDFRMISNSLEMFNLDNKSYPPMDIAHTSSQYADLSPNEFTIDNAFLKIPEDQYPIHNLTTPVPYMSSFPRDSYRNNYGMLSYGYGYGSNGSSYYILTSYGPDGVDGIKGVEGGELDERQYTGARFDQRDRAGIRGSRFILSEYRFDPSNGLNSSGDIIMIEP
jgi:hypothetical protein